MSEGEKLILSSTEPINDGGRRWNFIYYISVIVMLIVFIAIGSNFLGRIFAIFLGLIVGWLIKNKVAEVHTQTLRHTKFAVTNKIEYSQLIHELIPRLTPLGALVEKSSNENGMPIIEYQGAYYDIFWNEDDSFCIWWRQNLAKAFFSVDYIKIYRKEVAAMGIIGYHVQQICKFYDNQRESDEVGDEKKCKKCGTPIVNDAKYCMNCGATIETKEMPKQETTNNIHSHINAKKKHKFSLLILAVIAIIAMAYLHSESPEEQDMSISEQEILDELATFTKAYKEEDRDRYFFVDNEERWAIGYTDVNEFVIFDNDVVVKCFTDAFGYGCFSENSVSSAGFSYDIDENEARIYFDVEISDGHLTIASYNFDKKEYTVNIDGNRYETTDDFNAFVQTYNLVESMQADIDAFKEVLNKHGLSLDDLLRVKYKTIDEQFVPDEQPE